MTKLTIAFRNFANAPKMRTEFLPDKLNNTDFLEEVRINVIITLKCIFKK